MGEEVKDRIKAMNDDELRAAAEVANRDLRIAATAGENSEWHQACFAAFYMLCSEMDSRGIKAGVIH